MEFIYGINADNSIERFFNDCVERSPESAVASIDLYYAYTNFCEHNNLRAESKAAFIKNHITRNLYMRRTRDGRFYTGIKLKDVNSLQKRFAPLRHFIYILYL